MIEILIVITVLLTLLTLGCIIGLSTLKDKVETLEKIGKRHADFLVDIYNKLSAYQSYLTEINNKVISLGEKLDSLAKVYGERLDMHRKEIDELRINIFTNNMSSEAGIELNRYLSDKLAERVNIIDGIQDEELCFAEDTAHELGLLYDHLGLTIKTKEKKNGEITKKVVEVI